MLKAEGLLKDWLRRKVEARMVRLLEELLHPDMFNLKSKFKFKVKI